MKEQRILDTYEPAPLPVSDSKAANVAPISYVAPLESLEALHLFRLHTLHVNLLKGEQLESVLYRQKWNI